MNQIHVCYTVNTDYTDLCKISICDLIAHKADNTELNIYVVILPNDVADISLYEKFNKAENVNLQIIELDSDITHRLQCIAKVRNFSESIYSRWVIPFLPVFQKVNKVLHIDSDIFAIKDLTDVYNIDLDKKPVGICRNQYRLIHGYTSRKIMNPDHLVNSGILLFDCDLANKTNIADNILSLCGDKSTPCFNEEVAITLHYYNDVKILPPTTNLLYPLILEKFPHINDIFYWNSMFNTRYKSFTDLLEQTYAIHMFGRKCNIEAIPALDSIYSKLKQNLTNFLNGDPVNIKDLDNEIIYKYL